MSDRYFHFTLGPVQTFVSQARRTQDFWAGSFLLSWLSSVAIKAVEAQGGEIKFPIPKEKYMLWLTGQGQGQPPLQGAIPNRFKALNAQVNQDFNPELVTNSVLAAWQGLAELIWQRDLAHLASSCDDAQFARTRAIWHRQVNHFWETNWVLSDDVQASNLLDRRKNWRNALPPEEPGVKCMLMDGWQELSGLSTPNRHGLSLFWDKVRHGPAGSLQRDIREQESLCALAFIKRRFARHFADLRITMPGNWALHGWRLPDSVPSLAHIAASRWLANMFQQASKLGQQDLLEQFASHLSQAGGDLANERNAILPAVKDSAARYHIDEKTSGLDGSVWYDFLLNQQSPDLRMREGVALNNAQEILQRLQKLNGVGTPSPYYALLLMDGDSLGSQMTDVAKQIGISTALNHFTEQVPAVVGEHNGFLIYAGGDDVLALLAVDDAMACAAAIRACYSRCFAEVNKTLLREKIFTTLSGAINIGHIKWPLRSLLFNAHQLLDDVAKDQTGRDALAVRIWKHDKPYLCWSMPWAVLLNEQQNNPALKPGENRLLSLQRHFSNGAISDGFLFKFRKLILSLSLDKAGNDWKMSEIIPLLKAEYLHSQAEQQQVPDDKWFYELLALSHPYSRLLEGHKVSFTCADQIHIDAALLLRFLDKNLSTTSSTLPQGATD